MTRRKRTGQGIEFRHDPPRVILFVAVSSKEQASEDKISLEDQLKVLRADLIEKRGWIEVDVIEVPGYSRDFWSYEEFCADAARAELLSPARMFNHWAKRDFDVLACINLSRIARTASLLQQIIGLTYEEAGAYIYTPGKGVVPFEQRTLLGMIEGQAVQSEVTELQRRRKMGMKNRLRRGLPPIRPPRSHKYERDPVTGKAIRMVVNEAERPFLDTMRDLLLAGTPFDMFSSELAKRGFTNKGRRYSIDFPRLFFENPIVWGHTFERDPAVASPYDVHKFYAFDDNSPPPPGITIYRNTHPPAWSGEDAERIRQHMFTQRRANTGSSRPNTRHKFSLLMVCNVCGGRYCHITQSRNKKSKYYWRCCSNNVYYREKQPPCKGYPYLRDEDAVAWFDQFLRAIIDSPDVEAMFSVYEPKVTDYRSQIETVKAELNTLHTRIRTLIEKQAQHPALAASYDEALEQAAALKTDLSKRLETLQQASAGRATPDRRTAQSRLREIIDHFWKLPEREINYFLSDLLGNLRVVVDNGRIIGLIPMPPQKN